MSELPIEALGLGEGDQEIDMNQIVGSHNILFVCLDTLRYDVAKDLELKGETPVINSYGTWDKRHAPGNFTYPSHQAMFSGFLPSSVEAIPLLERERLFFPKDIGLGRKPPKKAFAFEGATFVEGLEKVGYETICVGGVAFFNKRSDLGRVLPNLFQKSYWNPSFACDVLESVDHQIDFIRKKLAQRESSKPLFLYLNIDSIHYPTAFYLEGAKKDSIETHAAALKYVDERIGSLFQIFQTLGKTFVILCSDHGTCYGEDGYQFHNISHEKVYTVPYKHFILEESE